MQNDEIDKLEFFQIKEILRMRGIQHEENICKRCNGLGVYYYPNTATWKKVSIAGQAFTHDVCDQCWGSGNKNKPWPSRRSEEQMDRLLQKGSRSVITDNVNRNPPEALIRPNKKPETKVVITHEMLVSCLDAIIAEFPELNPKNNGDKTDLMVRLTLLGEKILNTAFKQAGVME